MPVARALLPIALLLTGALLGPLGSSLPTPGLNGAATEALYGRLFPEALETNDYISLEEALASLALLDQRHPDRLEVVPIGESVGWRNLATGRVEPSSVFSVEVTNEKSLVPADQKLNVVFILAIHGNEKGAREGALRVIEDLAAGKGMAEAQPELVSMLDYQRLIFIFVNSDGWTHEEVEYRHNEACYVSVTCGGTVPARPSVTKPGETGVETQNFVRVNGAGVDLNRQYPTVGYLATSTSYRTMEQPEVYANVHYLLNFTNIAAAADVHGMLQSDNGYRILLKDGAKTQEEFAAHLRLAKGVTERLNSNPFYAAWQDVPTVPGAWGGEFAAYGATFDAIGYSASGTGGAFVTQHLGLGAPGFTIEQAYSHIAVDNYYPGLGAQLNAFHVESMRDTVAAYMEFVRDEALLKVVGSGQRIGWVASDVVVTNADDDKSAYEGWFMETDKDDVYDIAHREFRVSLNDYFEDLQAHLQGATLDRIDTATDLVARASEYDTLVVPGSAVRKLLDDPAAHAALKAYAEAGGHLVLTDEALQLLPLLGVVGGVGSAEAFAGYTDLVDRGHPLTKGLDGIVRVTYDANPLGFAAGECPIWYVEAEAFHAAKGDAVGAVALQAPRRIPVLVAEGDPEHDGILLTHPTLGTAAPGTGVNLGILPLGDGRVSIFGAALPDATEENNHPYGLEGYALSVTGNRILLNLLGLEQDATFRALTADEVLSRNAAPAPAPEEEAPRGIPGAGFVLAVLALTALAAVLPRRARR